MRLRAQKVRWKRSVAALAMAACMGGCVTHWADRLVTPTPTHGGLFEVAGFHDQVTGVAVSREGRIFVNFPHWGKEPRASVAEVFPDGTVRPYPDTTWNSRGSDPLGRFICVQSVFVDAGGSLWILDPASPAFQGVVPGGAKLVQVNLKTDRVERVIHFDSETAPSTSYLNDVRIDPEGQYGYITDSGIGAILVVDLREGTIRRLLAGHPSTKAEPGFTPVIAGRELLTASGQPPQINADGIALDAGGKYLYYHALTARALYRIKTGDLKDPTLSPVELGRRVERVSLTGAVDGMESDRSGNIYLTALEQNGIIRYRPDGELTTVIQHDLLQWPDSISLALDGYLYVTTSQIHLMPRFNNGTDRRIPPYRLFKVWPLVP